MSQPEYSFCWQPRGNCTVIKHLSCREAATSCQVISKQSFGDSSATFSTHFPGVKYLGRDQWSPKHTHTETWSSPKALWASSPKGQGILSGWAGRAGIMTNVRDHLIQQPRMNRESYLSLRRHGRKTSNSYCLNLTFPRRLRWSLCMFSSETNNKRRAPKFWAQKRFSIKRPHSEELPHSFPTKESVSLDHTSTLVKCSNSGKHSEDH